MDPEETDSSRSGRGPYRTLLEELLSGEVADDLRVVFLYDSESVDIAYLREDLLSDDMLPRVDELHARAKHVEMMPTADTQEVYGDLEMFVGIRENAVELHFIGGDDQGLVATADRTEDVLHRLLDV